MIANLFNTIFFEPLYNALVFISSVLPGHNLGLAIIILTLIVKLILFPLYHRVATTQKKLKTLEPELKKIKDEHRDNRQRQAEKIMELYRQHGLNPLSGLWIMLIQIPILLALFWVFRDSVTLRPELLYSFVKPPATLNSYLGFIDLTQASYLLAILTGAAQWLQMQLSIPPLPASDPQTAKGFSQDLAKSMNIQARYVLPAMMLVFSLGLPGAIALYWLVGSLFTIAHELLVKRQTKALLGAETIN
ncbi:MAG: YidC/Oxa1 family membrane protein insertase [Patescibacteria group bacterium]